MGFVNWWLFLWLTSAGSDHHGSCTLDTRITYTKTIKLLKTRVVFNTLFFLFLFRFFSLPIRWTVFWWWVFCRSNVLRPCGKLIDDLKTVPSHSFDYAVIMIFLKIINASDFFFRFFSLTLADGGSLFFSVMISLGPRWNCRLFDWMCTSFFSCPSLLKYF